MHERSGAWCMPSAFQNRRPRWRLSRFCSSTEKAQKQDPDAKLFMLSGKEPYDTYA